MFQSLLQKLRDAGITVDGPLFEKQAQEFMEEGQKLFGWRGEAKDHQLYQDLVAKKVNIAADIACFPNPHLNHLTPNSLDIERLYKEMKKRLVDYKEVDHKGMKDSIEGPPPSESLVFLRQTSYKALTEKVVFTQPDGTQVSSTHTARFGEIEQRGVAMTKKGRALYDAAVKKAESIDAALAARDYDAYMQAYTECFNEIPTSHAELRHQGLAFYRYEVTDKGYEKIHSHEIIPADFESCIKAGLIHFIPLRYEDFLPVSAAGIFASNLNQYGTKSDNSTKRQYEKKILEDIMDKKITEADEIYAKEEKDSKLNVTGVLGLKTENQKS